MRGIDKSFPVGVVCSRFNAPMSTALLDGAVMHLRQLGFLDKDLKVVEVPGAGEIPIVAQALAQSKSVEVIIALGIVIRGETSHYDAVCDRVTLGCQRVSLDEQIPIIFEVLMAENEAQIWDRLGGLHGHKGVDAVECAIEMVETLKQLREGS